MKTLLALLLFAGQAWAANLYVRQGAAGSGSGADWTNAYTTFPAMASITRGDIIYIADTSSTLTVPTLTKAVSGTTRITIQKATIASHGTSTGWVDTYGDGVAVITKLLFQSGYWTVDGVSRTDIRAGHGFKIDGNTSPSSADLVGLGDTSPSTAPGVTIQYVEGAGSNDQTDAYNDSFVTSANSGGGDGLYIGYCWFHDAGLVGVALHQIDGVTVEYSVIERNDSSAALHAEGFVLHNASNVKIRWNIISDMEGTGYIATPSGAANALSNITIYGNVFFRPTTALRGGCGNGIIAVFGCTCTGTFKVYNNTIVGETDAAVSSHPLYNFTASDIQVGIGVAGNTMVELVVQNNLWVDCDPVANPNVDADSHITTFTWSHNAYFNTTNTADLDTTNKQTVGSDPLPSWESGTFTLALATNAGVTLASPYDTDANGVTRGSVGVWDRGAFEFSSVASGAPPRRTTRIGRSLSR